MSKSREEKANFRKSANPSASANLNALQAFKLNKAQDNYKSGELKLNRYQSQEF